MLWSVLILYSIQASVYLSSSLRKLNSFSYVTEPLAVLLYMRHICKCKPGSVTELKRDRTRLPKIIWEQTASPPLVSPIHSYHTQSFNLPYLPGGANVHAHLTHDSVGTPHLRPIFAKFSPNERVLSADDRTGPFFWYLKGLAMATNFVEKIANSPHLSLWYSKMEWDIATLMCALTA